jgi:hypothetical protein
VMSSFWPDAFAISATPYVGLHSGDRPRKTPVASGTAQVGVTVPGYRCDGNYLITWAYSRRSVEVNGSGRNTGQSDKGSKSCRGQHQITPDERPRVRRSAGWRGWHSTRCFGGKRRDARGTQRCRRATTEPASAAGRHSSARCSGGRNTVGYDGLQHHPRNVPFDNCQSAYPITLTLTARKRSVSMCAVLPRL